MNRLIATTLVAAALALPVLVSPANAHASCSDRKVTGTVLGGVGGALIGNSISRGGGGALIGGLGGAVLGHEIAKSGCHRERSEGYGRRAPRARPGAYARSGYGVDPQYRPVRYVYYDQFGNPVAEGPVSGGATLIPTAQDDAMAGACHTEMQAYYDDRGAVAQRPVQICAR